MSNVNDDVSNNDDNGNNNVDFDMLPTWKDYDDDVEATLPPIIGTLLW
jgi:hypothetical protein